MTKRRNVRVDIEDIILAMDSPRDLLIDMTHYLDIETGRVLLISSEHEDENIDPDEIENNPQLYPVIPPFESRDDYHLMVAFAESIDEEDIRTQLAIALRGKGAFARFRDVIYAHSDLKERWYAMLRESQIKRAVAWLHELGIEPEYELQQIRASPAEPARQSTKKGAPPTIGLLELLLLAGDKTELISGRVYRRVVLPTPSEARRVFKAVARDICGYQGVGWRKRFVQDTNAFEMGDLRVEIQDRRVELSMAVSRELWDVFNE